MRKVLPVIAGALLAGAVGLLKNGSRSKKAASSKAKSAVATAQQSGPRRGVSKRVRRRDPLPGGACDFISRQSGTEDAGRC